MAANQERLRALVVISGRVQGVWFRGTASEVARRLNLTGWMRNRLDGKVEGVLEGDAALVRQMVSWCHKGPPGAVVESVTVNWQPATGEFTVFSIRR